MYYSVPIDKNISGEVKMRDIERLAVTLNAAGGKYHPKHEWQVYGETIRLVPKDASYIDGAMSRSVAQKIAKALHISGITYDDFRANYPQKAQTSFLLGEEAVSNTKTAILSVKTMGTGKDDIVDIGLNYSEEMQKIFKPHSFINEFKAVLGKGH